MNEVQLSWEPGETPSDDSRYTDPVAYFVQLSGESGRVVRTTDTTISILGLRNGVAYTFRVYSATAGGRSGPAGPIIATPTTGAEGVVAGVIVQFAESVRVSEGSTTVPGDDRVSEVDLSVAEKVTDDSVLVEFSEPVDLDTAERIASELAADELVDWAEPDQFLFTASSSTPTDWNLSGTYGVDATEIDDRDTAGEGVTVAVIDTGITDHPELGENLVSGYDFVSSPEQLMASRQPNAPPVAFDADYQDTNTFGTIGRDSNPADPGDWRETSPTRDSSWHGTKMAGLIHDVAPGASIQPIRALSWRGGLLSDIAASITWAAGGVIDGVPTNTNPSKVINMSFAVEATCPTALQQAIDSARERGSILIAAAGNANDDAAKYAPGNCNGVITVGSTTNEGVRADYSNYGATIDIAAPGGDTTTPINATSNTGTSTPDQPTRAGDFGTSVSAAHVSAGAAVLAARNTTITPDEAFTTLTGRDSVKAFANPTCDTNPDYSCGTGILTLAQIATISSGDQDFAMQFSRTGDGDAAGSTYATAPAAGFSSVTGDVTIMAWVNRGTLAASRAMGVVMLGPSGIFANHTTEWAFRIDTASGFTDYVVPVTPSGEWVHLTLTRRQSDGVIAIYVNGQAVSPTRTAGNTSGTGVLDSGDFYVAKFPGLDSINAQIDEVRVFNDVRTQSEIAADMHTYGPTNTGNMVAYYDFNEGPAGTTGTGTVYNRANGATSATNLRTVNGPTYTDVKQTTSNGNNTVVTFPRSYLTAAGGWRVPDGVTSADALVVAGGGGGGSSSDSIGAGGGGAGGLVYKSAVAGNALTLSPGSAVTVTVGAGGLGARATGRDATANVTGSNGQSSAITSTSAAGGGGGGGRSLGGASGGSGGGAGGRGPDVSGGSGTALQGSSGGSVTLDFSSGAGGGGATGAGGSGAKNGTALQEGGAGGAGSTLSISGTTVTYSAGGRGGTSYASASANGSTAGANTGGGGGGASLASNSFASGGDGGSGVVIVSYSTAAANGPDDLAMSFNGTTQYAQGGAVSLGTGDITIEAWVKPAATCSSYGVVVRQEDGYFILCEAGAWKFATKSSAGGLWTVVTANAPVKSGQWQHIAVSRSASGNVSFYFDGQLTQTASSQPLINSTQPISIGGDLFGLPSSQGFFNGLIDEVRLFNSVRSASDIQMDMRTYGPVSTANMVAYYDFNEGPAGTTGTSTIYNRASGATSATNLTTAGSPTFVDVKSTAVNGSSTVVTFPRSYLTSGGGWQPPLGVETVAALAVGGGGGGGAWVGGGGGGGGVMSGASVAVSTGTPLTVTIGQGGIGAYRGPSVFVSGSNGGSSTLGSSSPVTALGGGVGASWSSQAPGSGSTVATGGGGSQASGTYSGGIANSGRNGGSASTNSQPHPVGGGGGAGASGSNGSGSGNSWASGDGGIGVASTITGTSVYYGGGGGGSAHGTWPNQIDWDPAIEITAGVGGTGGGGTGGRVTTDLPTDTSVVGGNGTAGLGGGGGGAANYFQSGTSYSSRGGAGGSGVVIVSYATASAQTACTPEETQYTSGGTTYRVVAFKDTGSCEWTVPTGVTSVDYLVVAGGGGGGSDVGGGGGAGGLRTATGTAVTPGATLNVAVGAGGAGATGTMSGPNVQQGADGTGSALTNGGLTSSIVTAGGGGGGSGGTVSTSYPGRSGGSGGGAVVSFVPAGAATPADWGNNGGLGNENNPASTYRAGGGGGAGATGGNASSSSGGSGGVGKNTSADFTWLPASTADLLGIGEVSGQAVYFASGGGGGGTTPTSGDANTGGVGGLGGGGDGSAGPSGSNASAATGGGGGGSGRNNSTEDSPSVGGAGGSGVVVLRYVQPANTACTPFEYSYTSGGTPYTVVEFQGAGTCDWTPPAGVASVDVLAVGGGGGGGGGSQSNIEFSATSGGGGGGGRVTASAAVAVSGSVSVTVGAGGSGGGAASSGSRNAVAGVSGGQSSFGDVNGVSADGGGGGGAGTAQAQADASGDGGASGREIGGSPTNTTGGVSDWDGAGGGAGAGANGLSGGDIPGVGGTGGDGGTGFAQSIAGAEVVYGGGGGGGGVWDGTGSAPSDGSGGAGGAGGGGAGTQLPSSPARAGTDGLGGGGGGGGRTDGSASAAGADGGDGVVIVRYFTNWLSMSVGGAQQPSNYTYSPVVQDWVSAAPKVQLIDAAGTALTTSGVSVTATFTATSGSATLSGATVTTDANGVANFSSLILNGNAGTAGTLTFTATGYGSATSSSVTIGKAPLTVTAGAQSVAYGTSVATVTGAGSVTYSGFVNSETSSVISGTATYTTTYTSTTDAGTAGLTITPVVSGLSATNYSFTPANGTVTVTKANQAALSVTPTSGTYGTAVTLATMGGTTGGTVSYVVADDTATGCSESAGLLTSSSAGKCTVTATMLGNTNYNDVSSAPTTVTLGTVAITVTADDDTKIFGASDPTFSSTVTSGALVSPDAITSVTYTFEGTGGTTYAASTTPPSAVGTYSITPSAAVISPAGATSYTITYRPGTYTITSAAAVRLAITGSASQTAGTSQDLTIIAYDSGGNVATTYVGDKTLTFSGASVAPSGDAPTVKDKSGVAVAFGTGTVVTFNNGTATVSGSGNGVMSLYAAQAATIVVTDSSGITSASTGDLSVSVTAGSLDAFAVTMTGGSTPLSAVAKVAGTPFDVRVSAQDEFGNDQPSFTGAVSLTSTAWVGTVTATIATNGYVDSIALTPTVANAGQYVVATDGSITTTQASSAFTVGAGATSTYTVTLSSDTPTVGATVTVTAQAKDAYGNSADPGSRTITWSASGTGGSFSSSTSTTSGGVATVTYTVPATAGVTRTITATDQLSIAGTSSALVTQAGVATTYGVTLSSSSPTVGATITATAQLQDANGNSVAIAGRTVTWTTTAVGGSFASATSTTDASGLASVVYTVSEVASRSGRITATDDSSLTGQSGTFTTQVGPATKLQVLLPGETAAPGSLTGKSGTPTNQTAGTSFTVTVNAVDAYWNRVTSQTPTVTLTSSDGAATLPSAAALVSGTRAFTVTLKTADDETVTATGGSLTAGVSSDVTVLPASASSLSIITSPQAGASGSLLTRQPVVELFDAYGNADPTYSGDVTVVAGLTVSTVSGIGNIVDIEFADGRWMASTWCQGTPQARCLYTSLDGVNWSLVLDSGGYALTFAYTGSKWVAFGRYRWESPDGLTWSQSDYWSGTLLSSFSSLAYGEGVLVGRRGGGGAGDQWRYSLNDGQNWGMTGSMPASNVAYVNGHFFMWSSSTAQLTDRDAWVSDTGIGDWTSFRAPANFATTGFAYGNGRYVRVGYDTSTNQGAVYTSTNLTTWTAAEFPTAASSRLGSVAWNGSYFLASGDCSYASVDGITWTCVGSLGYLTNAMDYGNGTWIAGIVSHSSGRMMKGGISGTLSVTPSSSVAAFSDLRVTGPSGTAMTMTFDGPGLTGATATVTPTSAGPASQLALTRASAGTAYGAAFTTQPQVTVQSAAGTTLSSDNSTVVTATISSGGSLVGTVTATAVNGVATFSNLGIQGTAGTAYEIRYSSGSLYPAGQVVTVTRAGQTVTFGAGPGALTYGDSPFTVTATSSSGESVTFTSRTSSVCTVSGSTVTIVTAGTCTIRGSVAQTSNFDSATADQSYTINQATQAPLTLTSTSGTFGNSLTLSTSGGTTNGSLSYVVTDDTASTCTVSSGSLTAASAGTCTVTATMAGNTNFLSVSSAPTTVTLAPRPLTISADDEAIVFGAAISQSFTISSGTLVGSDAISGLTYTYTGTGVTSYGPSTTAPTAAGTYSVTPSGLTLSPGSALNYNIQYNSGTVTIGQASQSITFNSISNVTYGDAPFTVSPVASSGLTVNLVSNNTAVCTVTGFVVTIVGAGSGGNSCSLTASQPGNTDYSAAVSQTNTFSVLKANQASLTMTSASTAIFGETISLAASGGSGTGSLGFSVEAGTCTISGSTLILGNASSLCEVSATKLGDANYNPVTSASQTITIDEAGQTVAFTSLVPTAPQALGTYTPTATAISNVTGLSSGINPTFTPSGACTISGGVITFTAGTCTITAAAASNINFDASPSVTQVIEVGSINQNITFAQPTTKTYGSSSFALGATASSGLTVEYALGSGITACSVSLLGVVTLLDTGTCQVTATQSGQAGVYAPASNVTRAFQVVAALPSAPTITSASASSQSITVGVAAPGFTGAPSETIAAYQVVATPVGAGTTVTSTSCITSPCTITGLVNGTAYTVTAAAINTAGTGPASVATGSLTPATAAFAVGALSAVPGNTFVDVSWTQPTDLGGGTFTRYDLYYRVVGGSYGSAIAINPMSTTSYQVTGLDNGTSYDFKVVTITTANGSEFQGNTAEVVQYPSTVPTVPRSLTVLAATATEVQFSWSAPVSNGGAALTTPNYTVTVTGSAGANTVTCAPTGLNTFCSASGLTNGASYVFSVVANNRMGSSVAATTTYAVPSANADLSDLEVTGTGGAVALSPTFTSATLAYSATVPNGTASVTVTPTTSSAGATVTVDGVAVVSGSASESIALSVGVNEIEVEVTASDPRYTQMYTLSISRSPAPPTPSNGGGVSPNIPVTPPATVISGTSAGAVLVDGVVETNVVLVKTSTNSGWEAVGTDFQLSVDTETASGTPEPLTPTGVMQVPQGGRIVVNGDGYMPDTQVAVFAIPRTTERMGSKMLARAVNNAMYIASANVSSTGSVSATMFVPQGMNIGDYVLQINGETDASQIRSVNLLMNVIAAPPSMRAGVIREAAFYQGKSAVLSDAGKQRLRTMVKSIPVGAQDVSVVIVGVSISLGTVAENIDLARDRAQVISSYLQKQGVSGEYTVTISTTFTVDAAERATRSMSTDTMTKAELEKPAKSSAGKPLSTATITFEEPQTT